MLAKLLPECFRNCFQIFVAFPLLAELLPEYFQNCFWTFVAFPPWTKLFPEYFQNCFQTFPDISSDIEIVSGLLPELLLDFCGHLSVSENASPMLPGTIFLLWWHGREIGKQFPTYFWTVISVFWIVNGSIEITFWRLPPLKVALFILTPSTVIKSLFVEKPLIIGLPPPN